jgi:hypothetical protein
MDAAEDSEARAALALGAGGLRMPEGDMIPQFRPADSISTSYENSWKQATERWEGYKNHYVIGQRPPFRFHMVRVGRGEGANRV